MENVFNIKYNYELDKLEIVKTNKRSFVDFVQNHKFFSIIFTSFFIFAGINLYLIYSFMKILENV